MKFDALLTRHLATELNSLFGGQPVHGVELLPESQRLTIDVGETRLLWNLHPTNGYLVRTPAVLPLEKPIQLPKQARWKNSRALFDERIMIIEISGGARPHATSQIVVELLTNQWNAITLDSDGKVLRRLVTRMSTGRDLRRGQPYAPPAAQGELRATASPSEWQDIFGRVEREEWKDYFLRRFAYASPYNVDRVFASQDLKEAYARYQELLRQSGRSVLTEMEAVAGVDVYEDVSEELARRLNAVDKKIERLNEELQATGNRANATRAHADLLMTYASTITKGVKRVTLPDFEGNDQQIDLDPALTPIENAQEMYAEAKKQARASDRIPRLIEQAEKQRRQLLKLNERAQRGELGANDLRALIRKPPKQKQTSTPTDKLPYRRYKTSSGLEVRVGRNSRANDELTLHHTSPRDIWLHARHVGGAHVVLRWNDVEANPPQRDLYEAAVLAAVHSQAKTSGTVPVDYTRRKYVTKKRKSPPGQVFIERAKTVFVEPSTEIEEQLRWPDDG